MARLIPDDVAERNQGPWPDSEHATLNKLAVALAAEYAVFHGIHWARIDQTNPVPQGEHPADAVDILNFLSQRFGAKPHIGLLGERARSFSSRLSAGLATWASRLELSPHRLHVRWY
jgi:hypothetical protein